MKRSDRNEVGSLRSMMMTAESLKYMIVAVEDMKVGDPERASRTGHRNRESWNIGMAVSIAPLGLMILQEQNVYLRLSFVLVCFFSVLFLAVLWGSRRDDFA